MKTLFLLLLCCSGLSSIYGQDSTSIYPLNWWVGMKHNRVQLMLHGKSIGDLSLEEKYPGVTIEKIHRTENKNYLFADLLIAPGTKPGTVLFTLRGKQDRQTIRFELKPRRKGNGTAYAQGVRSQDLIYLVMPDRFSNGDYGNDRIAGMKDQSLNRDSMYHRHGGDIQGVINHLDYLQDLGVTTV